MKKDLLLHQWSTAREFVLTLLEDTDSRSLEVIPDGFKNNLLWQFGHLATVGEILGAFYFNMDAEVYEKWKGYFDYGTSPNDFDDNTPGIDEVRELLKSQLAKYKDISEEKLNEDLPEKAFKADTVGQMMAFIILHEAIHVGKIEEMKKLV